MADIELVIKIDEDIAHGIIDGENDEPRNIVRSFQATIADAIKNGTPHESVTEFADRCRECGREKVLDKIRAEIMQLDYDIESVEYDHNDMAMTEEVHTICREEVLHIIAKYKTESEE